jgi:hypothetical protein
VVLSGKKKWQEVGKSKKVQYNKLSLNIVDRKAIRSWITGKEAIKQTNLKRTRAKVNRRSSQAEIPELEQQVFNWTCQVNW